MNPDVHLVIQLQSLDNRIADLKREIAELPRHIGAIEKTLDGHLRKAEADRAALAANQKDRKRLDGDVQVQQQKISRLKDQMLEAKTNEQYRAFQHEIEYCEGEIRKAEDAILDLMAESEPLEANLRKAEAALKEEKQHVEAEKGKARERTAADQKSLAELFEQRAKIVASIKQPVYSYYERMRKKWHGSAVAEVLDGHCSACQIGLRPQYYQDLRRGEALMNCESCGRIIYYNPPIDVEAQNSSHAGAGTSGA